MSRPAAIAAIELPGPLYCAGCGSLLDFERMVNMHTLENAIARCTRGGYIDRPDCVFYDIRLAVPIRRIACVVVVEEVPLLAGG